MLSVCEKEMATMPSRILWLTLKRLAQMMAPSVQKKWKLSNWCLLIHPRRPGAGAISAVGKAAGTPNFYAVL